MTRDLPTWSNRSPVVASMSNPSVVAFTICAAASEYERAKGDPMPIELSFLVPALVFHRGTREALPNSTKSHLTKWVNDHPVLQAGFAERAHGLVIHTREGIRFGMRAGILSVEADGLLKGAVPPNVKPPKVGDIGQIIRASGFVGKWFTKSERPSTIFALLGVKP